jgi:hypothetical protein
MTLNVRDSHRRGKADENVTRIKEHVHENNQCSLQVRGVYGKMCSEYNPRLVSPLWQFCHALCFVCAEISGQKQYDFCFAPPSHPRFGILQLFSKTQVGTKVKKI